MKLTIALCNNILGLQQGKIFDKECTRRFPGAGWANNFAESMNAFSVPVVTGDIAIDLVKKQKCDPAEILVIQELNATHGKTLVKMGARPFVISCYESPLYAFKFYDSIDRFVGHFENRILFSGIFKEVKSTHGKNIPVHFQCFYLNDILPPKPWRERKLLVQVLSNKYFKEPMRLSSLKTPIEFLRSLKYHYERNLSPHWKKACANELHSKRLEAIEHFAKTGRLDLYGRGWHSIEVLSKEWQKRLGPILTIIKPKAIHNKFATIADYKYSICFENLVYPGYITEKIIDCFVAGVIPIYLGAPDIESFVPIKSFIDMRQFGSWEDLDRFLIQLPESEAMEILESGRNFLTSDEGRLFSYEGCAEFMQRLILERAAPKAGGL